MAERKTSEEKIRELEAKIEQMKAQKKALIAREKKAERAARTHRLIQLGALSEKYFNCADIQPEDFEKLLAEIVKIQEVKSLISSSN